MVVNTNRETSFRNIRNADELLVSTIDEQADSIYRYSVILLRDPNVRYLVQDIQRKHGIDHSEKETVHRSLPVRR